METCLNLTAIELLPAPATVQFHALALNRFHPSQGFNQMALNPGIGFSLIAKLPPNHRGSGNGEDNKERHNCQGPKCKLHAVEQHHTYINQRETSIQNNR